MKRSFAIGQIIIFGLTSIGVVLTPARPALAQAPEKTTKALTKEQALERARELFSKALGVDKDQLKSETDLVTDLLLDRAEVFYAVVDIYQTLGLKAPKKPTTNVGQIAELIRLRSAAGETTRKAAGGKKTASYVQTVYYATNRNETGEADFDDAYGIARTADRRLKYGIAEINIPFSHKRGKLESPWLGIRRLRDPRKHIYVLNLKKIDRPTFFESMRGAGNGKSDVLVYIHGFNVSFANAIKRAGQIAFDFDFKGIPITFSWPSDGSIRSYNADWEDVTWSVKYIEKFLTSLREKIPKRKIHLVVHSMGSRGLLHAMRLIAYRNVTAPVFDTVILCAPDFDADLFVDQIAGEVRSLAKHWVIYSSNKDIALVLSEQLNSAKRLGRWPVVADGYQIIDATDIEVTPWSVPELHSYYATKKQLLSDMISALKGVSPKGRGLVSRTFTAGSSAGMVWSLK